MISIQVGRVVRPGVFLFKGGLGDVCERGGEGILDGNGFRVRKIV